MPKSCQNNKLHAFWPFKIEKLNLILYFSLPSRSLFNVAFSVCRCIVRSSLPSPRIENLSMPWMPTSWIVMKLCLPRFNIKLYSPSLPSMPNCRSSKLTWIKKKMEYSKSLWEAWNWKWRKVKKRREFLCLLLSGNSGILVRKCNE